VLIRRHDDVFVPRGNTQIASDDVLLLLAERDAIDRTRAIINARTADAP
jgi:Trk K+ transport system NAD-binding subunit